MGSRRPDDAAALGEIVTRLMTIKARLGRAAYRDAVRRTLTALGAAALADAERRANRSPKQPGSDNVLRFPGPGRPTER